MSPLFSDALDLATCDNLAEIMGMANIAQAHRSPVPGDIVHVNWPAQMEGGAFSFRTCYYRGEVLARRGGDSRYIVHFDHIDDDILISLSSENYAAADRVASWVVEEPIYERAEEDARLAAFNSWREGAAHEDRPARTPPRRRPQECPGAPVKPVQMGGRWRSHVTAL